MGHWPETEIARAKYRKDTNTNSFMSPEVYLLNNTLGKRSLPYYIYTILYEAASFMAIYRAISLMPNFRNRDS